MKRLFSTLVALFLLSGAAVCAAQRVPPGTDDEIRERLQPFGEVCVAGNNCAGATVATSGSAAGTSKSAEEVYNTFCFACHAAGVGGAPKLGSAEDWAPRLDLGMDAMWETTLNGRGAMPPKGTCMNCSEDELRATISYMSGN